MRPPGCPRAGVRLARGEGLSPEPRGHGGPLLALALSVGSVPTPDYGGPTLF